MTDQTLFQIQCPMCKTGPIFYIPGTSIKCPDCKAFYPFEKGIFKLIPFKTNDPSLFQKLMEWKPVSHIYESKLWRRNPFYERTVFGISFEKEFDTVLRAADLSGDAVVLDLACGPGIYSRPIAKRLKNGYVFGLDLSIPMLDIAVSNASKEDISNFFPVYADATNLPFPADYFNTIICCGALYLFPDKRQVLSEVRRVLKPGGRFVISAFYRRLPGLLSKIMAQLGSRLHGVYFFRPEEINTLFTNAGLSYIKYHHAKRLWMIVSGQK